MTNEGDIFVNDKETVVTSNKAPKGYVPINLSSAGKLSAPAKIHVRNYNGQDALDLSMATEDDMLETLVDVLVGMIHEDVQPMDLHEFDIEEIMLNVYYNFWSSVLEYPYIPLEDEYENIDEVRAARLKNADEKLIISLNADQIKTKNLKKEFVEPMIIEENEDKYEFILPRIGHALLAKELTEDKFIDEEDLFSEISQNLIHNQSIETTGNGKLIKVGSADKRKFTKYQAKRMKYFTSLVQCQLIKSVDGKELVGIEEKRAAYLIAPLTVWEKLNKEIKEKAQFGIEHKIKVSSPLTGKEVERRFQFRFMDFLPSME